jgi:hypothetical protein
MGPREKHILYSWETDTRMLPRSLPVEGKKLLHQRF